MDKVTLSWGHDEYLYRVLINHGATIPPEGLAMIRQGLLLAAGQCSSTKVYYKRLLKSLFIWFAGPHTYYCHSIKAIESTDYVYPMKA